MLLLFFLFPPSAKGDAIEKGTPQAFYEEDKPDWAEH